MERHDETTGTRDIAEGGGATAAGTGTAPPDADVRFERDAAPTEGGADRPEPDTAVADADADADAAADQTDRDTEVRALLPEGEQASFRGRWEEIQTRFVDDPRRAVEDADALVATVMRQLAEGFASERERLEGMWGRGEDVGTEDLRVTLQRYRSFFQRLLAA
jgi:hypothetical protein